ncbi:MAG TPA: HAMP domain-containing histidine kinase, partial [Planctomycetes bacterium]|nr:HAMP domain-containing histidine kinase [Planctomycetota bacterium]
LLLDLDLPPPPWALDWLSSRGESEIIALGQEKNRTLPPAWEKLRTRAFLRARARTLPWDLEDLHITSQKLPSILPLRGGREILVAGKGAGSAKGTIEGLLAPAELVRQALAAALPGGEISPARLAFGKGKGIPVLPGIRLLPRYPRENYGGNLAFLFALSGAVLFLGILLGARSLSKERRSFQQREDFLRSATHELKTPLASQRLLLESLVAGRISGEKEKERYLKMLQGETERLSALVEKALDYKQVERGEIPVSLQSVETASFLEETAALYAPQLQAENRKLSLEAPPGIHLRADPALLRRILWNLLENARLHGGGDVFLSLEEENGRVSLRVEDQGEGLDRALWERVFEPFARGPGAGEGRAPGLGLGLSFARRLAAAQGGSCRIVPSSRGFAVEVTFPREEEKRREKA